MQTLSYETAHLEFLTVRNALAVLGIALMRGNRILKILRNHGNCIDLLGISIYYENEFIMIFQDLSQ